MRNMAAAARIHRMLQLSGKAPKAMKNVNYEKRAFVISTKEATLTPVKSVKISFDPFHERCRSIREVTFALSQPKIRQSNPKCGLTVDIKSDLSQPLLEVEFVDGDKTLFKTENLNRVEVMKIFNQICAEKAPEESSTFQASTNTKPKPKRK